MYCLCISDKGHFVVFDEWAGAFVNPSRKCLGVTLFPMYSISVLILE